MDARALLQLPYFLMQGWTWVPWACLSVPHKSVCVFESCSGPSDHAIQTSPDPPSWRISRTSLCVLATLLSYFALLKFTAGGIHMSEF